MAVVPPGDAPATRPAASSEEAPLPATRPDSASSGTAAPAPQAAGTAPYRLLLRLPAADPSAPAEAVTQALRAAGLDFVVETIERAPVAADPQPPEAP